MSEQWDVGRALALSAFFRLLHGAGRACAVPFLTLYLRQLGLSAPLVGVAAGARYMVTALWVPLCLRCPRGRRNRRLLLASCLLGSAGASLLLTLVPPVGGAPGSTACNGSRQPGDRGAAATPGPATGSYPGPSVGVVTDAEARVKTTAGVLMASRKPTLSSAAFQGSFGLTDTLGKGGRGVAGGDTKASGYLAGPSGWTASAKAVNRETQEPEVTASSGARLPGLEKEASSLASAATDLADNAEKSLYSTESSELSVFKTTLPAVGDAYVPGNLSDHQKDTPDVSFKAVRNIFPDREYHIFLMVLSSVVLWELLATSLKWMVNEGLYEYLDFVDATDRYGRLWIWSYLGASIGACSIAAFVDQLSCFLGSTVARLAVHFYVCALLVMLSSLVSVFLPVHIPKKTNRVNKTAKALALLWSDGRAILYVITIFLTGAAGSAVQNFLFWQMQDRGSSELYMGLSVAVGLLAEILLYFFKGKLLRTFSSSKIVAVSLSLLAVQLLCYSFLWTVWSVLLIQILSAFSSGALWWVVTTTVDDIATPGMERPLHAVLQGLFYGGGASLGSFAGGFVVKHFGLAVLYRACCMCLVLWLLLFLTLQSKLPQQKLINYSHLLAADSWDMSDSDEENKKSWLVNL
ncbi:major facilitator superfamily domain-containing protein 6-like protein B [Opisthocomus hoazin]|uniref:major facilitator superfamily domain-containing protein 6-like protein B n=1 Tax=Opisthocomus hoazin TaxID=30419 RepID=UPI003F52B434